MKNENIELCPSSFSLRPRERCTDFSLDAILQHVMPSYAAFLGHQPRISLAELSASVPGFVFRSVLKDSIVLFESPVELDAAFLDTLGGIVILARRVTDQNSGMRSGAKSSSPCARF